MMLFVLIPASALAQYGDPLLSGSILKYVLLTGFINIVLGIIVGAVFGILLSDSAAKLRMWAIIIFVGAIVLIIGFGLPGIGSIFIAIVTAAVVKQRLSKAQVARRPPPVFGSAKWATLEHLAENNLLAKKGFFLGSVQTVERSQPNQKPIIVDKPIHYQSDRHLLTVAPTRSGKGVSAIIPNLLTYEGSVLVIDPKGENAMITAKRRGSGDEQLNIPGLGQEVHIVDPWGITKAQKVSRFNPLDWLQPDDEDITDNAMMLADAIIKPHEGAREPFWDEEAKALLMGLILYVALEPKEQGNRDLGRVRDIIVSGGVGFEDILTDMSMHVHPIISSTAERTRSKEEKILSSVMATLQSHTHFLDSPRIRESLRVSDFRFEDLKKRPMSVYLVLPADRLEPFGRWLRLLIQQSLTVNARNIEVKPAKPVLFLLDEMASLGRLTMVEQAFGLMAGFGMQLWGIVQDLSQLEVIYGKGWETFISNSGVLQYFGSRDKKSAEYFSALCGVTTVRKFSIASTIARTVSYSKDGGSSSSSSQTTTGDDVARPLIYPDELMVLKKDAQLLLVENCDAIASRKVAWYQDDGLKKLGVNLRPELPQKAEISDSPKAGAVAA